MDPNQISPTTNWALVTGQANFDQIKGDGDFWSVVALGRAVNAILFVHQTLVAHEGDNSPAAVRARYNSVLFSCAILFEGHLLVQKMHKQFQKMPEFQKLSNLLNAKDARKILDSTLSSLRNRLVFHFDPDEVGKQLQNLKLTEPALISAMGEENGQIYYWLSDLCAFRTLNGPSFPESDAVLAESDFTATLSNLIIDFSNIAQEVIAAFVEDKGWYLKVLPNAIPSAADAGQTPK
jgi:hypothetical protein